MSATFAAMQVIRYARTRHLTITTQVSRFVYLLHTAPTSPRAPLLRIVQHPPPLPTRSAGPQTRHVGSTHSPRLHSSGWSPTIKGSIPLVSTNFTGGPHDRTHPNHLGTHPNVGDLMPSLQDQLDQNEWDLEQARRAGNPNAIDLLLDERNNILNTIHNTRTTR